MLGGWWGGGSESALGGLMVMDHVEFGPSAEEVPSTAAALRAF